MGKYEPLKHHLENLDREEWEANFAEIEGVLGFALPPSASTYSAWWANESKGTHVQKKGWLDAGWETGGVDLHRRRVRFRKKAVSVPAEPPRVAEPSQELWERARRLSGIEDRDALIAAALTALIRREAAKGLIALGGTMPDFTAPPRERPTW